MGGGQKQIASLYINKDSSNTALSNAYANINGTNKEIFSSVVPLSSIGIGSIVKFNTTLFNDLLELTDYIVLGPSRIGDSILLLQRYTCDKNMSYCQDTNSTEYYDQYIDLYLSNDDRYKGSLDESIKNYLVKTSISRFSINKNTSIVKSRDVFILCCKEVGLPAQNSGSDSDGVSYLDALKIATGKTTPYEARQAYSKKTGNLQTQWLREEFYSSTYKYNLCAYILASTSGSGDNRDLGGNTSIWGHDVRPALSFSKSTLVDKSSYTLISK